MLTKKFLAELTTASDVKKALLERARWIANLDRYERELLEKLKVLSRKRRWHWAERSQLHNRKREVCVHPPRAIKSTAVYGRMIIACSWCGQHISAEKIK